MNSPIWRRWAGVLCVVALAPSAPIAAAQDSLAAVRELYVSAAYEDALAMLGRLRAADVNEGRNVDVYRAFCLLALGKTAEARRTIDAVVSADPSYRPSDSDAGPRVRAVFREARRRLLPGLAQQEYARARAEFDRKNYQVALQAFRRTLEWLSDPDLGTDATAPPLADLSVLVSGFLYLSQQAADAASRSAPRLLEAPPPDVASQEAIAPDPVLRDPLTVYAIDTPGIVAPVAVRAELPRFRGLVTAPVFGALEVVIDENGAVTFATMRTSVNAKYDRLVKSAALEWRYKPATLDGLPVKFRKMIGVSIVPEE